MLFASLLTNPIAALVYLAVLFGTISVHEFCHAWAADELGDPTPRLQGRLTLDPRAHIDMLGAILLLFIGFGWGKPVQFDPYNLKNPRRDAALISLAGPGSNLVMAIAFALLLRLLQMYSFGFISTLGILIIPLIVRINIILGLFNLIPFAPLDGFKIVGGFLSHNQAKEWYSMERFGPIFLLFFIFPFIGSRSMLEVFLGPVIDFATHLLIP